MGLKINKSGLKSQLFDAPAAGSWSRSKGLSCVFVFLKVEYLTSKGSFAANPKLLFLVYFWVYYIKLGEISMTVVCLSRLVLPGPLTAGCSSYGTRSH